ncbi:hypothetical protein ACWDPF_30990, partial [Streptomyces albogriseolus]
VDAKKLTMKVIRDGKVIKKIPVTTGAPGYAAGAATPHRRGPGRRAVRAARDPYLLQRRACVFCHTSRVTG